MKVLAVGDIHTKTWIIDRVEKLVHKYDAVVFVGDYADDFNTSPTKTIETWDRLKTFQEKYGKDKVIPIMGNHDFIYVHKTPTLQSGYSHVTQLLINSPENAELKRWLLNLLEIREIDGVKYTHAGITEEWKDTREGAVINSAALVRDYWRDDSPLWVRPQDGLTYKPKQVFGHTPSKTCWEVEKDVWCIDTFSTHSDNSTYGDGTVLEIIDGKQFNIKKLEKNGNNNTSNIKARLSVKGNN